MIDLAEVMHQESAYRIFHFDREKLADHAAYWLTDDNYLLLVAEDASGLVGMYGGFITEYYFGRDLCAYDLWFFVKPQKRGSRAALLLFRAFEDWAFGKGAQEICPGTTTRVDPERTASFLKRLGYSEVGQLFKKAR